MITPCPLRLLLAFSLLLPPAGASGQAQTSDQNAIRRYNRGTVITTDRTRYAGRSLVFSPQSLTFTDTETGRSVTLPRAEVDYVSRIGSYWKESALTGGLLALTAGLGAWAEVEADPTLETKDNVGAVVLGLTAAGLGLGAFVGTFLEKETTVFQRGQFVGGLAVLPASPGANRFGMVPLVSFCLRL